MMLLLLGGLGIDGSRQLNARGQAVAFAEEAARAGAQAVERSGILRIDEDVARQRVSDYCDAVRAGGALQECRFVRIERISAADPRRLVVVTDVKLRIDSSLLGMIGVRHLSASALGKARPFAGIDRPDDYLTQDAPPAPKDPAPDPTG